MQFRVLGPLEVRATGTELSLGTRKQQVVLARLAVDANRVVSVEDIIDELWPQAPPASAAPNVRGYVGYLRRCFESAEPGAARLIRQGTGYLLRADTDELDLLTYSAHVRAGRDNLRAGNARAAAERFQDALACWRGSMLTGLPRGRTLANRCAAVEDERLEITEELAAVQLRLDEPQRAVETLREQVRLHPLRERGLALLIRALHRTGDTSGAVTAYATGRAALREQLGIEPGPELQELHRSMLTTRAATAPPFPPCVQAEPARSAPAQLPLDVYGFAGRDAELAQLDALLTVAGDQPTAVMISAIAGTAGVGKTALALHWAHRVADRFPDGQLYVNLRGFNAPGSVMTPGEAIRSFLHALQVPPSRLPSDFEAQTALYRTLLADKAMLIVLDNARDADQVRPLLPGAPGYLVLVTSRNRLTSLVAADGAYPLPLDLLSAGEARDLLTRRLGGTRVAAEPDAVDELVTRCVRLPLALAIVAANAATRPQLPLQALADRLRNSHDRLDALSTGDTPATDLRAVFSSSYLALGEQAARLFRLLGLHPGPDISAAAAGSLAGLAPSQVQPLLVELARAHLIVEPTPGRYTLHDLLRAYASDLAHGADSAQQRHAATRRLLDHYLHTSYPAAQLLDEAETFTLATPEPGTHPEHLTDSQQALAWLTAEHRALLAAIDHAAATGFDTYVWQQTWALWTYLDRQGHWHEYAVAARAAVAAAGRLADPHVQVRAHRLLAHAYRRLGRPDESVTQLQQALDLCRRTGDTVGQAYTHQALSRALESQDRHVEALDHDRQALDLFRATDDRRAQAEALNSVGWGYARLGQYEQTLVFCAEALQLVQELGERQEAGATWDSLGYAHHHLGHYAEAISCYQRAVDLTRDLGDRYSEALVLHHLGDSHLAAGEPAAARHAYQQSLTILDDLNHSDAKEVLAKLDELGA